MTLNAYAECHYAEFVLYADCHGEVHYAGHQYSKCHYAVCRSC